MAWLPHYIDEVDVRAFVRMLSSDPQIAFIVGDGPGRWVARKEIASVTRGRYCMWHIPSGALPLLRPSGRDGKVEDAWSGWKELRSGADASQPYFGPGHPGIIWWNVRAFWRPELPIVGMSSFEWIGNHYRMSGLPADLQTEVWWQQLKKWVKRQGARRIPRMGPIDGPRPEVWAFPSALAKIASGMPRADNPY
jgi:hypothetical protein